MAMSEKLDKYVLKNGMVLLGERMEGVGSVAFMFMLPAGTALLPEKAGGAGNVIVDWVFRGAGSRTSRQVVDALDGLGLQRSAGAENAHTSFSGALEAGNLSKVLEVYADVILRPTLADEQFSFARDLALQELAGLGDDPRQKVMLDLREQFYPWPLGRNPMGTEAELQGLTPELTRQVVRDGFDPSNAFFTVAGKYDWDALCSQMEKLFGGAPRKPARKVTGTPKGKRYLHEQKDGAQVHIGIMTPTITVEHPDYYNIRAAADILGGGMSARLFTEVREKRGLCYAVGSRYHCIKGHAGILCYCGTTPEKAQETLDVTLGEFGKLSEGITEDEVQRAKVGLKSSLIMGSESSMSRAGAIAGDWHLLGRVRTMDEVKAALEGLTVADVSEAIRRNALKQYTIVTIGPKTVDVPQ
jgi:predicted Zn-dependent peptidase